MAGHCNNLIPNRLLYEFVWQKVRQCPIKLDGKKKVFTGFLVKL